MRISAVRILQIALIASSLAMLPVRAAETFGDLFQPTDIAIHPNGTLYIADSGNQRIVILDREGRLVGKFGRKGLGPGEFQRPCAVGFLSADEVLVADNTINKIQIFTAKGEYRGVFLQGELGAGQIWVLPDGKVLTTESDGFLFNFKIGDENPPPPLRLYDRDGHFLGGFGALYSHEIPFVAAQKNHGSAAFFGDRIAFARVAENKLEVFHDGKVQSSLYAPAFPVREPDGEMKQTKQADGSVSFRMVAESDAHCLDLTAIDGEHLLMLRAKAAEDDGVLPTQLVVLSWNGELEKVLPGTYRAKSMALDPKDRTVYLIDENDDGWFLVKVPLAL